MKTDITQKWGLIKQVIVVFIIGVMITGIIANEGQRRLSDASIRSQVETRAEQISSEVTLAVDEYPAHEWLLRYWYKHADDLDIEYDVDYGAGTATEAKCRVLSEHYPGLQLKYVTEQDLAAMTPEDQKLYAEVAYSWLITRINQIKRTNPVAYLFCVLTYEPYHTQFFIFSAADEGAVRGTNYEEVYPLGVRVTVSESQQEEMRHAVQHSAHLADAGDYVDYYAYMGTVDGHVLLIGLTYDLTGITEAIRAQTTQGTLYAMINQVALSILCLLMLFFFVLRPLEQVQHNIRLYTENKNSAAIIENLSKVRPHNEIGQLSEDVTQMVREIDDHVTQIETITAEKERISTELNLATRIQADMLPNIFPAFPERMEFDIYATMDPAREVGGDFYDFFLIDDDHLCIIIADVAGKGIPAALFMMASMIILANNAMAGKSPAQVLRDTNVSICTNNREEMFVTVWLGILEISTGKLTAANAGHEYPVILRADGGIELFKDKHGFVVGTMEEAVYHEYELQMATGEKLFLYTDGLPEATSDKGEMYGTDRILAALGEAADQSPEDIIKAVRKSVDGFVKNAEQFDDLTMLCLEYRG
ncbi:MAG: PP2C family protein-serine/threonine phosphatase [Mogibacterium sp.]|nr:PP2C family protein-serine/threonine phosphatase [Mogibacterium sp.]